MINQNVLNEFVRYLKKEKYRNKIQELILEYCTDNVNGKYIYLVQIRIKKSVKNKGWGSAIMSDIIELANVHHLPIILWTTDIFKADLQRLKSFYLKLGFVPIKYKNDSNMIYYPKTIG